MGSLPGLKFRGKQHKKADQQQSERDEVRAIAVEDMGVDDGNDDENGEDTKSDIFSDD